MVLLGVNCGFGNSDVGTLPRSALDMKNGWVTYPRPKTGVERRAKLWPETAKSLNAWLKQRPTPKDASHEGLVFITKYGGAWHKDTRPETLSPEKPWPTIISPLSAEMRKLLKKLKLHRPGLSYYTLRHVCETIGGESCDQVAVNHIMGHADISMAATYRERISDERLVKVSEHIRHWLFDSDKKEKRVQTANASKNDVI
jgi:integrase